MEKSLLVSFGLGALALFLLTLWIFISALRKYSRRQKTTGTYLEEKEEKDRETAKRNAEKEKRERQAEAKKIIRKWWLALFLLIALASISIATVISFLVTLILSDKVAIIIFFIALGVCLGISGTILFQMTYKKVDERWEWIIEFFGEWFNTWEPGLHFLFPFFMSIKAEVYMGDQMTTLYMDEQERDGEVDAMIEFTDTSSAVIVRLFYFLFSSHRPVYNIDNVVRAIREKMDAGLRAYFGKKKLDEAIAERAEIDLEKIIKQSATDPAIFKFWGAEMRSLAVVDITLPTEVREQRDKILIAEKDRDAAVIEVETAKSKAEAERIKQEVRGKATGQEIEQVAKVAKLEPIQAATYLLNKKYFETITPNKGIIIAGQGTGAPIMGAEFAAGFSLTSEKLGGDTEKPAITEKTKKTEKDKGGNKK